MKVARSEKDYEPIAEGVDKILNKEKILPENIFKREFKFFLFITFDEIFMRLFFNHVKKFLLGSGESSFWLTSVEPDPKLYFGSNFNFFGAIEFSISDVEESYLAALHDYPENSPADALAHNSNLLMVFSQKKQWAIYGDRDADIAICAFTDQAQMEAFRAVYGSDLLGGVEVAAEYAYGRANKGVLKNQLCSNFL